MRLRQDVHVLGQACSYQVPHRMRKSVKRHGRVLEMHLRRPRLTIMVFLPWVHRNVMGLDLCAPTVTVRLWPKR